MHGVGMSSWTWKKKNDTQRPGWDGAKTITRAEKMAAHLSEVQRTSAPQKKKKSA